MILLLPHQSIKYDNPKQMSTLFEISRSVGTGWSGA
jgi:hypothetical protein